MAGGDTTPSQPPPAKRRKESNPTTAGSIGQDLPLAAGPSGRQHRRRRRRKARQAPPILSLGEDLLLEVFLRLPSLATLVRAALACRPWRRAVASSPDFRRRFLTLHPAPLLGHFFETPDPSQIPNVPAFAAFSPTRPRDRDDGGGDFFLTSLQVDAGQSPCWDIVDCRRGNVLLMNWDDGLLVVMNPLTQRCRKAFGLGCWYTFAGHHGTGVQLFSTTMPVILFRNIMHKSLEK
ncbi:hypothetical protein ACP70R_037798 [Stipagrostis hirtigluma subsp. patula]